MAGVMVVILLLALARMPGGKVDPDAPPEVDGS